MMIPTDYLTRAAPMIEAFYLVTEDILAAKSSE